MATLQAEDYAWIVGWIRSHPTHKATLRVSGLSRTQIFAGIQAIEDWEVNGHNVTPLLSRNLAIETAVGQTTTLAQEKVMWYGWSAWKSEGA